MASDRIRSVPNAPSPEAVELLDELIAKVLPPLQARVRRNRIPELAARIAALTDPRDFSKDNRIGLQLAGLSVLSIRVVAQLQHELADIERRVAAHAEAYARAKTDEVRRARLEIMIDETAPDARSARADRKALDRHLDLDALRERYDEQREQLAVAVELGIMIIGAAIERGLQAENFDASSSFVDDPALGLFSEVQTIVTQAEPVVFLLGQLGSLRRWPTRLACIESLETILASLGLPRPPAGRGHRSESPHHAIADLRAALQAVAMDRSDHEWVQARALSCLRLVDLEAYRSCVRSRLGLDASERPEWPKRDFLVRGLIIDQLAAHASEPGDLMILCEAIAQGDPSEFVRIAHAKVLPTLALTRPDSFAGCACVLARVEESELPRVHAQACLGMVRALRVTRDTEAAAQITQLVVEQLAATIVGAKHALVVRIACEQTGVVCELLAAQPRAELPREQLDVYARQLVDALHECLADSKRSSAIHESASTAIEAIDCALRSDRAEWTKQLRAAIDAVPSGQRGRVPMPVHRGQRPDHAELVRILPMLTSNDWGLDVDEKGGRLLVRRGDRRVTRMWRVLHEMKHPAGNKRQAFRHTTGRAYAGRLRAHPGRLDEVTATVVPGERLHFDAEGGWGRHLPLVDDVLGLTWLRGGAGREVEVGSSHGVTTMRLRGSLPRRLRARWRLNFRYPELSDLRRRTLMAEEPSERRRYADELRERYGVELEFRAHPSVVGERPVPPRLAALFPRLGARPSTTADVPEPQTSPVAIEAQPSAAVLPIMPVLPALPDLPVATLPDVGALAREWINEKIHYFLALEGNSQAALGVYVLGLTSLFLGSGWWRRRSIARARSAIPLSVGGWGTRGKSGTERLKAGLFHGLGFRTFSKTTGCEAMFIHAAPLGPQVEIYTFRPYGKATIWEQRNLLELAAGLHSEVFLWECMALNPEYVDIMQNGWMRDDFATLTNTYPDHEDIQGPAGIDVATVIGRFIPQGNLVLSSELAFNPVLRDAAKLRNAELIEIGDHEGDLLPDDLLGLFPYSEHPRNIALVTELARQIGIDPELAIVTMADYVYPDLGVLKYYPDVQVRGRTLSFVNGCSANERAGFLNNWKRTGCVDLAAAADPAKMVITVVNNRDDRVARSEVFSRILVNDVACDAHVLIGTNLAGLSIFIDRALEVFASSQELVDAEVLTGGGAGHELARTRLRALLLRVRAPVDIWWEHMTTLLRLGFGTLGRRFDPDSREAVALRALIDQWRKAEGSVEFESVLSKLSGDREFDAALRKLHDASAEAPELIHPHEVGRMADFEDLLGHMRDRVARMIIGGRFSAKLEPILQSRDVKVFADFTQELSKAWVSMFRALVIVVHNAGATGDQIIDQCARAVPPGVHLTIMGTQNIKGTGLDFVYRWLALDAVCLGLPKLDSDDEQTRLDALRMLDAHSDFGFTDTGMLVKRLPEYTKGSAQEASLRNALCEKARLIHEQKLIKLDSAGGAAAKGGKGWTWLEGWVEFLDGAIRYRQSRQLVSDLQHFRVSHNRMAVEMREIYARAKGGWLGKLVMGWVERVRRKFKRDKVGAAA
jgi:poly-gamma-glutamate synthase PgsB/CapB